MPPVSPLAEFAWNGPRPLALVTGGARRIGAVLAETLAAHGFDLCIHCHRSAGAAHALSRRIAAGTGAGVAVVQADLADAAAASGLIATLDRTPAVLVNNASIFEEDRLDAIDAGLWHRHLAVNTLAPVLLVEALVARLPADGRALVVNMSDAKLAAPNPDFFGYTVSKAGLAVATEMLARTLAPRVRVNAIAPAVTLVSGPQSRENFERVHAMNPLGRGVEAEHIAAALLYLASTPTVTGQTLVVDAGQRFLALPRDVAYMPAP